MRRIGFAVVLAVSVILASLAAEAQQQVEKVHRVGFLGITPPTDDPDGRTDHFLQEADATAAAIFVLEADMNIVAALFFTLLFLPVGSDAQQVTRVPRVGWMWTGSASTPSPYLDAFRRGMRDLGYVEGQSFILGSARGKHVSTARIRSPLKREQVPSDPHDPDRDVHAPRPVARRSRHEPGPPRREHYRAHPRR